MKLISKLEQLISNIETVEKYLTEGTNDEKLFIRQLIRKGKCFVAYQINNEIRLAPSRFLGYINNCIQKHLKSREEKSIDGRETNPVINDVLNSKLLSSSNLEKAYLKYCSSIGIIPSTYSKRRYWSFDLSEDFAQNKELDGEFPEGKIVERIHKNRERNAKVVAIAKQNFISKYGKLFCQVCKFDFEKKYGRIGRNFIEGHHTIPVSEMKEGHVTKPEEIALLCANCHRMAHIKRPWLSMKKLHSHIKK